jgi:lambda repressor-like predicted transcriptional regulator
VHDADLVRRRAAGESLRSLAADYGVAHTTLSRYFARKDVAAQLRAARRALQAEGRAARARRAAERQIERTVRRQAKKEAALGGWGFLLIPLAPTSMAILFISVALFVFGVCAVVTNIVAISLSQAVTPDRLLGRMTASRRFAVFGVIPLGSLTAGALGSSLGLHTAIWICAIGASIAFLPMLLSPVRSVRTLKDAEHSLGLIHDQIPA